MARQTSRGTRSSQGYPSYAQNAAASYGRDASRQAGYGQDPYGAPAPYGQGSSAYPYAASSPYGTPSPYAAGQGPYPAQQAAPARGNARRSQSAPSGRTHRVRSLYIGIIMLLVGLLVGFLATFLFMNGRTSAPVPVAATLSEGQLDTVVGTYRYGDETYKITAREAILGTVSLESVKNDDGTYDAPTSDMVLSYARNRILALMVEEHGITVSDDEVAQYALDIVGTDDMALVADYFDMEEDQAREIMAEAAAVRKLRESVTSSPSVSAPQEPTPPADGGTEVGNAEYANYIIGLLGSHWDAATGTWADTDNAYYAVLQNMQFAPGLANYEAAEAAYGVAYQEYVASTQDASATWTDFVNQYLDQGSISIATLRS